jgi:Zn-dependent M28 family amino/carboxypeptidase
MHSRLFVALSAVGLALPLLRSASAPDISAARMLARTKVISSDAFEGRGPGTPGEERTVGYLVDEFKKIGLEPGNPDGTYVQDVPMIGVTSKTRAAFVAAGKELPMQSMTDYVCPSLRAQKHIEVKDSDLVFVGYGVVAPEYGWDDFKGVDVRGKTVVMLINDPPVTDPKTGEPDPKIFGGKAMTYYGRWTYKYEIATARGAAACLIIHETAAASYPYSVVVDSNGRENFDLPPNTPDQYKLAVQGWMSLDAAKRLLAASGQDFDALKKAAVSRDFHPVALNAKVSFAVDNSIREIASKNVIAKLPGSDPKLRDEYLVYTAHWDHLGRDPSLKGDQIFNGADDNASGVATVLELGNAFASLPPSERPKRSILFLSVTGEEKGLLGSRYYAEHPLYPLAKTLADFNTDGANYYDPTRDMIVVGYGASTLDDVAEAVAKDQGRYIRRDPSPERGRYYRSDHFEFAKVGVPALYAKRGVDHTERPAGWGEKFEAEFDQKDYHKPSDEVRPDWTFAGGAKDVLFLFEIGRRVANADTWPEWRPGNEFKARRDAMLKP